MTSLEAKNIILETYNYTTQQSAGYQTWGKVDILQIAVRINQKEYAFSKDCKNLKSITENDIIISNDKTNLFGKLFHNKKKIEVILITKQTYAAQVKEEIPPILDDQAQLLGVSIRIAKNENNLSTALCSRYAAIFGDGRSICVGTNLEDAYVAAQLLEKTSKAFVEAKVLGGAKSINKIEAWLMQQFYQLKYSKEAKKNK
ncbi:MAG: hypothetical protein R2760_01875 [Chitinophagales bacterium]